MSLGLGRIAVLLMDADEDSRERLSAMLRPLVRKLLVARDEHEAEAALASDNPSLVIASVSPPQLGSVAFCERLRKERPGVHIVAAVERYDKPSLWPLIEAGVSHFVAKPIDPPRFRQIMESTPLQHVLSTAVQRQKELTQTILDAQENLLVVTDGRGILEANESFYRFFGFDSSAGLTQSGFDLGSRLIKREGYVFDMPESGWLEYLLKFPQRRHKLLLERAADQQERVFLVKARAFPRSTTLYVVTLTDITEVEEEGKRFELLATMDPLTRINNRVKFNDALLRELNRAERYGGTFSLIIFDIDHFKEINDTHGHHAGDQVLIQLARTVEDHVRASDVFARWGGEEFVLLAPQTGLGGAQKVAEHLRHAIAERAFSQVGKVTCSFGVASFAEGDDVDTVMRRADDALYRAKSEGRNRVRVGTT